MTVSLKDYSHEQIEKLALIDLAREMMLQEKEALNFHDLYAKVTSLKGLTEEEKEKKMSQFYTDLNMDGNFKSMGSNTWILKRYFRGAKSSELDEELVE